MCWKAQPFHSLAGSDQLWPCLQLRPSSRWPASVGTLTPLLPENHALLGVWPARRWSLPTVVDPGLSACLSSMLIPAPYLPGLYPGRCSWWLPSLHLPPCQSQALILPPGMQFLLKSDSPSGLWVTTCTASHSDDSFPPGLIAAFDLLSLPIKLQALFLKEKLTSELLIHSHKRGSIVKMFSPKIYHGTVLLFIAIWDFEKYNELYSSTLSPLYDYFLFYLKHSQHNFILDGALCLKKN